VLETDADRERFKVKRRFQMRDGERYFGEGRDNAMFALMQKQMKKAGDWRIALRKSVLAQLTALGRDARLFNPQQRYPRRNIYAVRGFASLSDLDDLGGLGAPGMAGRADEFFAKEEAMLDDLLDRDKDDKALNEPEPAALELGKSIGDPD